MSRLLLAACALALAAAPAAGAAEPPSLGTTPFTLAASKQAKKVNVAVDAAGTGHFAWDVTATPAPDPLVYCRVPRGARACAAKQTFALPLESFGEPQVLTAAPNVVVLIANRCCDPASSTYAIVSADGGQTFAAPKVIGSVQPGQAVLWPGTDTVLLTNDVVTGGISVQGTSLSGGAVTGSANVGDGPSQGYDGSVGFPVGGQPLVAFDDLRTTFWRQWSGAGSVNDLASWGPKHTLGKLGEVRFATGPKGAVLVGKRAIDQPYRTQFVARAFDPATGGFRAALPVSAKREHDVIFMDALQDAGGNSAVVWIANGRRDPVRYRVSADGGATWRPERTLVAHTDDGAFNLQVGAAPDGGGFVAYDRNGRGPLRAVAIPRLSAQR